MFENGSLLTHLLISRENNTVIQEIELKPSGWRDAQELILFNDLTMVVKPTL